MDAIDELLSQVETLAPTPKLLPQLIDALSDADSDIARVVEIITFDPALTARLLQVCNSAYYAFPTRASAVGEAVNRLGFHGVYMIVAVASSGEFLKAGDHPALDPQTLWRHLATSAFAAQNLAPHAGAEPSMLFTTGLLHDLGKVPLAEVLKGDYDHLITDPGLFGRPLAELESASFGLNHAEVGARLLEQWDFAPEFVAAVRWHHHCAAAGEHTRLAAAVELADHLAHSLLSPDPTRTLATLDTAPALTTLGMDPGDLPRQLTLLDAKSKMIDALCGG